MGESTHDWSRLRERLTGKWQVPLLAVSVLGLGAALLTYQSPTDKIPFDERRDALTDLIDRGLYTAAMESAGVLLQIPGKSDWQLAPVHAALARARMLRAERNEVRTAAVGKAAVEHFAAAREAGLSLTSDDSVLLGRAHEWAGEREAAIEHYERGASGMENPDIDLRWHLAKLKGERNGDDSVGASQRRTLETEGRLEGREGHDGSAERVGELEALVADGGDRPDVTAWALEQLLALLCDAGRQDDARKALVQGSPTLESGEWTNWKSYLEAYVDHRTGESGRAEGALRVLRNDLQPWDDLYDRTGWLLGRVLLGAEGPERPQEAMAYFQDVASRGSSREYAAACELGLAEALTWLERYDEALDRYAGALSRVERAASGPSINRKAIEVSLTLTSDRLSGEGATATATRYAELAVAIGASGDAARFAQLLERLAELKASMGREARNRAERSASPKSAETEAEARALFLESGRLFARVAELQLMHSHRSAAAMWSAAERTEESGDAEATVAIMRRFLALHPESSLAPRALHAIGGAQQRSGALAQAVETHQENYRRFGRTPHGAGALIPLATCYMGMGRGYSDKAEQTLRMVLEDSPVFTPGAPEYADALFLLGDLLNRTGAYERAIPVLEEAMERYPRGAQVPRARFLLGDCYLQSGQSLLADMEEAKFGGELDQLRAERQRRLRRAATLFGEMVGSYESRDASTRTTLDELYLRHARLYRADCHFELGEYEHALADYERAAWIYKGSATALSAYVQILNCHVFAGNEAEAEAALRRAAYLVETLPDEAFEDGVNLESREDWRRYFEWVKGTELF